MVRHLQKQIEHDVFQSRQSIISSFYPQKNGSIQLSFSPRGELFDATFAHGEYPRFTQDVFASLDAALIAHKGQPASKISVAFPADAAGAPLGFTRILEQNLRFRLLKLLLEHEKIRLQCMWFLVSGIAFLAASYFLENAIESSLLFDVVNILGSLLIWTAGEKFFFEERENRLLRRRYADLLKTIGEQNGDG